MLTKIYAELGVPEDVLVEHLQIRCSHPLEEEGTSPETARVAVLSVLSRAPIANGDMMR